ncbi:MAG: PfkB family carbohydrate kinase, partial [Chloroflexota bacterium]
MVQVPDSLNPDQLKLKTQYGHKIKDLEGLREAIGPRPRKKSVIMCHGTFDIVHPGHLRHLMYAKEKADLLIASVTADAHIMKANHRPFVPQELRAANLAALEMVDFVIVDPNATPIEHMRELQPDFFAKGYEYFANGVPPKTQEELDTLAAYGGEMVFTPGDVVYSSSALIEASPPNLGIEKLLALMDSEGIGFDDLRRTLHSLTGLKVHVVGDTIVDTYSYCSLLGATAKSPTFSVKLDQSERFAGGAAVVARHMKTAGADVTFTTVLGNDELRQFVLDDLEKAGVHVNAYVDPTRPTTHKERFITDG